MFLFLVCEDDGDGDSQRVSVESLAKMYGRVATMTGVTDVQMGKDCPPLVGLESESSTSPAKRCRGLGRGPLASMLGHSGTGLGRGELKLIIR